jgi:Predicted exonuclease of the beta-lactamase fold involved in RNA processing
MKIKFCGAAKTVTGSCYYVQAAGINFLIDCGLFQGEQEELNKRGFPFIPADIDFVILTHAHIDHTGRLPLLIKEGFRGAIYCTPATAELTEILLRDSANIQEKEAEWQNKKRMRRGQDTIEPMYTMRDVEGITDLFCPVPYGRLQVVDRNINITFKDAGHVLGSSIAILSIDDSGIKKTVTFTGDLGDVNIPVLRDYEYIDGTDYLICESTYGNRLHKENAERENLGDIIVNTVKRGGNVVIPSFAVGRTQELLYMLNYYIDIENREKLKDIDIYLDSPLAAKVTEIFERHKECYNEDALQVMEKDIDPLYFNNLKIIENNEESMALNGKSGIVIISSSGMCEAGRIKHHLKHNIWRKNSSIVFVGYQAEGTLGRKILSGEKTVNVLDEEMVVQAEIYNLQWLSSHADQKGIINWITNIKQGVKKAIFLVHGEPEAQECLREKMGQVTNTNVVIPGLFEEYEL